MRCTLEPTDHLSLSVTQLKLTVAINVPPDTHSQQMSPDTESSSEAVIAESITASLESHGSVEQNVEQNVDHDADAAKKVQGWLEDQRRLYHPGEGL